jgi:YHS domain-containing protein
MRAVTIITTLLTVLFLTFPVFIEPVSIAGETAGEDTSITPVEPNMVCMVDDGIKGVPQIAVEVEGKTYYGCCPGCVNALKNDRSKRFTMDPLTGREVDKATAYIVPGPGGRALYFESSETAEKYAAEKGAETEK